MESVEGLGQGLTSYGSSTGMWTSLSPVSRGLLAWMVWMGRMASPA